MKLNDCWIAVPVLLFAFLMACEGDSLTAPDGATPQPTAAPTPEPTSAAIVQLECVALNPEFESPEFDRQCNSTCRKTVVPMFTRARRTLQEQQPHLFGARNGGREVLNNREYQVALFDQVTLENPRWCFEINPRQDDEIFGKQRGVPAVAPAFACHVDHLTEPGGGAPNEATEFCAAQSTPPIF